MATPEQPRDPLGRRQIDQYGPLTPEVVHVLLIQMQASLTKLESASQAGFSRIERQIEKGFDQMSERVGKLETRVDSLEGFKDRSIERDSALARSEGRLEIRWPAVAALLTVASLIIGLIVTVLTQGS